MTLKPAQTALVAPTTSPDVLERLAIREALSRLGNARAEAVFAQARADRQLRETVERLHMEGLTIREIARATGTSSAEVSRSLERLITP